MTSGFGDERSARGRQRTGRSARLAVRGGEAPRVVLVVASEADARRYMRECLRDRAGLRVVEAASVSEALACAERDRPGLVLAHAPEAVVLAAFPEVPGIVVAHDATEPLGGSTSSGGRPMRLAVPFSGTALLAAVDLLSRLPPGDA